MRSYDETNGDMQEIWSDDDQPTESKKNHATEQTLPEQHETRVRSASFFPQSSPISIANSGHATPPSDLNHAKTTEKTTFKPGKYEEDTARYINAFVPLNRR